jgi:hypothetical protein
VKSVAEFLVPEATGDAIQVFSHALIQTLNP